MRYDIAYPIMKFASIVGASVALFPPNHTRDYLAAGGLGLVYLGFDFLESNQRTRDFGRGLRALEERLTEKKDKLE